MINEIDASVTFVEKMTTVSELINSVKDIFNKHNNNECK